MITELTLRLYGRPGGGSRRRLPVRVDGRAANTVIQTIQLGIPVARIEIIDEAQLQVVNAYSKTNYPLAPTLFFEFHGTSDVAVEDQIRAVEEIAARAWRSGIQMGLVARGSQHALAGAAQRLLCDRGIAARSARLDDRYLRADFAPRGMHSRDAGTTSRRAASSRRSSDMRATATST